MAIKLAINGFGRIGRLVFRAILERQLGDFDVVAVNDLTDAATLAHLFKYDSVHGRYSGEVGVEGDELIVDGKRFKVYAERDPKNLNWGARGVDVVVGSTSIFRSLEIGGRHLDAG